VSTRQPDNAEESRQQIPRVVCVTCVAAILDCERYAAQTATISLFIAAASFLLVIVRLVRDGNLDGAEGAKVCHQVSW